MMPMPCPKKRLISTIPSLVGWLLLAHSAAGFAVPTPSGSLPTTPTLAIAPSSVHLHNVTHAYPDTLWRRLTSSVPRRTYALQGVNLTLHPANFTLLTGPSSAGKSTLFGLLLDGKEAVPSICGSIEISCAFVKSHFFVVHAHEGIRPIDNVVSPLTTHHAQPILLVEKPSLIPSALTPRQYLQKCVERQSKKTATSLLLDVLLDCLNNANDTWMDTPSTQCSQSQLYVVQLVLAAFQSMTFHVPRDITATHETVMAYPAPILLLDEWLDKETSGVIRSVQSHMEHLVACTGAVIICATHYPDRFDTNNNIRHIKLQLGRVVGDA